MAKRDPTDRVRAQAQPLYARSQDSRPPRRLGFYNPRNCCSFSAVTDTRTSWTPLVVAEQAVGAKVARFLLLIEYHGSAGQLAPQRPDDPHAVFALKDRNEFILLGRESDHVFCRV